MAQDQLFTNNAAGTLASPVLAGATSIPLSAGAGALFPVPSSPTYFMATLTKESTSEIEIVKATAKTGADTFTVLRAQEGTTPLDFDAGDIMGLRPTAIAFGNLYSYVDAAIAALSAVMFGIGQQWEDHGPAGAADRSLSVTYTNTDAKAILVFVYCSKTQTNEDLNIQISGGDNVEFGAARNDTTTTALSSLQTVLVPPGATYEATLSSGTVRDWFELRTV